MKALVKKLLFGEGRRPCRIPFGLFRGLSLSIDPACETILWLGLYEAETTPFLRRAGCVMKTMIDVGAGYGEMTAWALRQPQIQRVLAFDPKPERWPVFRKNMELNGVEKDSRLAAVADFFPGTDGASGLLSLSHPVLIKLDVDGAELAVLSEIEPMLGRGDVMLLVETHSPELDRGCRSLLERLGYSVRTIPQAWWRKLIPEQRPIGFNRWLWAER